MYMWNVSLNKKGIKRLSKRSMIYMLRFTGVYKLIKVREFGL